MPTNAGSYTVAVCYETATEIWTGSTTFVIARAKLPASTFGTISEAGKKLNDVPSGSYYADALAWAFANDIVGGGYGDGIFGSEDNITRAQIVTMLYRMLGGK